MWYDTHHVFFNKTFNWILFFNNAKSDRCVNIKYTIRIIFFYLYNNTAILWNILTENCPDWELSDPAKQVTEKCPALKINELRIVRPCIFH